MVVRSPFYLVRGLDKQRYRHDVGIIGARGCSTGLIGTEARTMISRDHNQRAIIEPNILKMFEQVSNEMIHQSDLKQVPLVSLDYSPAITGPLSGVLSFVVGSDGAPHNLRVIGSTLLSGRKVFPGCVREQDMKKV